MQEDDLPVVPTVLPGSMINTPRDVLLRTSRSGVATPEPSGASRTAAPEAQDSPDDSFTSRPRPSVGAKIKRSSSVLLAA